MKNLWIVAIAAAVLSACSTTYKPNVYQSGQTMTPMKVTVATVIDVREVEIQAPQTGVGATAGGAAGGVVGNNDAGGKGGIIRGIAGAVVGGIAGAVAEKSINGRKGIEVVYRVDGADDTVALVQEIDDTNPIRVGDRIRVLQGSSSIRAIKLAEQG
jgi:outer membrane lipoprotein SlyB